MSTTVVDVTNKCTFNPAHGEMITEGQNLNVHCWDGTNGVRIYQEFDISEDVILNGCPAGGNYSNRYSVICANERGNAVGKSDIGETTSPIISANDIPNIKQIQIIVRTGVNVDGLVFKPMLRLASVADASYAPYSNICPITGWTGVNVTRTGKNLFDKTKAVDGAWLNTTTGEVETGHTGYCVTDYIPVKNGISVYIPQSVSVRRWFYDAGKQAKVYLSNSNNQIFTPTEDGYIRVTINTNSIDIDAYQIEFGSTATAYEPYQGDTYAVTIPNDPGTVYGGTLDVVTGELVINWASIASYDGETLPGEWISDRDVYAEGRTPTTGAQVVYELATPITYTLTPVEIQTLIGQNNVWSDAGNVSIPFTYSDKIAVKADKVFGATNGNFAALNSSGNIVDSGHKPSDYVDFNQLEFIDGTNSSASPALTGVTTSASLSNGKIIYYRLAQSATVSSNNALTL